MDKGRHGNVARTRKGWHVPCGTEKGCEVSKTTKAKAVVANKCDGCKRVIQLEAERDALNLLVESKRNDTPIILDMEWAIAGERDENRKLCNRLFLVGFVGFAAVIALVAVIAYLIAWRFGAI